MRIREIAVTPVAFRDPPLLNAAGVHEPWAVRTIVEITTDEGLTGVGETYGDAPHLERVRAAARELIGVDVYQDNTIYQRISAADERTRDTVFSPFEVACLDIRGKAAGRPVVDLLGGRVRDAVPYSAYLFYKWAGQDRFGAALDPDGIVAQARLLIEEYGFRSIKLKGGVFPPGVEIDTVRALREAFPDHPLRLDPNTNWTVTSSIEVGQALAGVLEYLEDPTAGIDGMSEVAPRVPMPLATNMCVVTWSHLPEAIAKRAIGVLLTDHHYWGGLTKSAQLAKVCAMFGIELSMHSNSHLGISLAAMTHLAAATPNLGHDCDTHTPWQDGQDVIVPGALRFTGGAVPVPAGPGLGVELDRDALARMHEDFLKQAPHLRGETAYMHSINPSWERPLW